MLSPGPLPAAAPGGSHALCLPGTCSPAPRTPLTGPAPTSGLWQSTQPGHVAGGIQSSRTEPDPGSGFSGGPETDKGSTGDLLTPTAGSSSAASLVACPEASGSQRQISGQPWQLWTKRGASLGDRCHSQQLTQGPGARSPRPGCLSVDQVACTCPRASWEVSASASHSGTACLLSQSP